MRVRYACAVTSTTLEQSTGRMAITVNGASVELDSASTVSDLLAHLQLRTTRVAVAVNKVVVPRSRHGATSLSANDEVEILEAVGGG